MIQFKKTYNVADIKRMMSAISNQQFDDVRVALTNLQNAFNSLSKEEQAFFGETVENIILQFKHLYKI